MSGKDWSNKHLNLILSASFMRSIWLLGNKGCYLLRQIDVSFIFLIFSVNVLPLFHQPPVRRPICSSLYRTPLSVSAGQQTTEKLTTQSQQTEMVVGTSAPLVETAATSLTFPVAPSMNSVCQQPALPARVYPATPNHMKQVGCDKVGSINRIMMIITRKII